MVAVATSAASRQCPRCFGRGYQPKARKPSKRNPHGLGFRAVTCPRCGGTGAVEQKPPTPAPIVVIFRVFRTGGDVIALMPGEPADVMGRYCTCYQHVGQHGQATYTSCMQGSRAATDAEAAPLLKELRAIGYDNLRVQRRYTRRKREGS